MTQKPDETVPWWTQAGTILGPPPAAFANLPDTGVWLPALHDAGYEQIVTLGDTSNYETVLGVVIYQHEDKHLMVEIETTDRTATTFFVARENAAAFWIDKMPQLTAMVAQASQTEEIQRIRKTIVAYVRHGSGTLTIDEEGEVSRDEAERERKRRLYRKQEIAREKAANAKATPDASSAGGPDGHA